MGWGWETDREAVEEEEVSGREDRQPGQNQMAVSLNSKELKADMVARTVGSHA